jgi:uncharacterized membrane protein YfcA
VFWGPVLTDPLFYLAAIPAVILLGLAKGGFAGIGILGVPLMALVISPVQAAAILLPILLVQDVVSVWVFRRARNNAVLARMLPGAAIGVVAGYMLAALLVPLAIASTWAGVRLVRRVDATNFYRIIHVLMVIVGAKLVWDGAKALI